MPDRAPGHRAKAEVSAGRLDLAALAASLPGVRRSAAHGCEEWRYHGRLVARRLDETHLVIRADFDVRDELLRRFPGTFSVPVRYRKHMMVVADLARGDPGGVGDALEAAWILQASGEGHHGAARVRSQGLTAASDRRSSPRRR